MYNITTIVVYSECISDIINWIYMYFKSRFAKFNVNTHVRG